MKEMGSWQLVIRMPAFQASWWFTWELTCQKAALECGPGTLHPTGLVWWWLGQGHPQRQDYLRRWGRGGIDYLYP